MSKTIEQCEVCGDRAYHFPVGAEYEFYCCYCFNGKTPCPDDYCDSHDES